MTRHWNYLANYAASTVSFPTNLSLNAFALLISLSCTCTVAQAAPFPSPDFQVLSKTKPVINRGHWVQVKSNDAPVVESQTKVKPVVEDKSPPELKACLADAEQALAAQEMDRAGKIFKYAASQYPSDLRPQLGISRISFISGRNDEAIKMLNTLIAKFPKSSEPRAMLGNVFLSLGKFEQAKAQFLAATALDAKDAESFFHLAQIAVLFNEQNEAIALSKKSLAANLSNNSARVLLARLLRDGGNVDDALVQYKDALAQDPDNPDLLGETASLLAIKGRPQEAVEKLMQAYRLNPESAEIQKQLVTIYGARRDWPNAGDVANSWAQLEPENTKAQLVQGWCSLMNHESLDATVILKQVCRKAPQDIEARNIYGIALLEQRKFDDAQKQFEAALALDAQYLPARLNLIALYGFKGQNSYAIELIEKLQLQEPENSCVLSLHAWLEMKLGNYDAANDLNSLALSHDPQEPLALIGGGIIFRKQGKLAESVSLLQKTIKLFPDSPLPLYELSATYVAEGKFTQAIESAQLALQIAPSNLDAKAALAFALIAAKNYEGAIPLLKECVLRNPKDLQLRMVLSRAQVSRGDREIAQTTLEKARTAFPDRAEPLIGLANLAFDFRNYRQSEQLLQDALVCDPDNREALISLARAYFAMGKFDNCYDQFQTLQNSDLDAADILLKARCEYALRQFTSACADYEKVMHAKSTLNASDFVNYAQALLQSGQYSRAQELIGSIEASSTIKNNGGAHELERIQSELRNCMRRTH